jgi:hypothetical protein
MNRLDELIEGIDCQAGECGNTVSHGCNSCNIVLHSSQYGVFATV